MGFRWRKRTKGKNGWINFSYSKKNGFNTSITVKSGPFTWNSGNRKRKSRLTTKLPGGFYHVSSSKSKKKETKQGYNYHTDSPMPATSTPINTDGKDLPFIFWVVIGLIIAAIGGAFSGNTDPTTTKQPIAAPSEYIAPAAPPTASVEDMALPAPSSAPQLHDAPPEVVEKYSTPEYERLDEPETRETFRPSHNGDYIYRPGATPDEL